MFEVSRAIRDPERMKGVYWRCAVGLLVVSKHEDPLDKDIFLYDWIVRLLIRLSSSSMLNVFPASKPLGPKCFAQTSVLSVRLLFVIITSHRRILVLTWEINDPGHRAHRRLPLLIPVAASSRNRRRWLKQARRPHVIAAPPSRASE